MEMKHFQGPNFSMEVPSDWFISSSPRFQAIFLGPETPEGVQPNLSVAVRRMEENVTVQAVSKEAKQTQEKEYPGYTIIDEIDYTEKGGVGLVRKYKWQNENYESDVIQTQAFFLIGRVLYTLTATQLASNAAKLESVFDQMIRSFRIN